MVIKQNLQKSYLLVNDEHSMKENDVFENFGY